MADIRSSRDGDPWSGVVVANEGTVKDPILAANARDIESSNFAHPPQPTHNRKHRLRELAPEHKKDNNEFHNDEAFEAFEMGKGSSHEQPQSIHGERWTASLYQDTRRNHHAKGTTKGRARDRLKEAEIETGLRK